MRTRPHCIVPSPSIRSLLAVVAAIAVVVPSGPVAGQCAAWADAPMNLPIPLPHIRQQVSWDPDSAGPEPSVLVAAASNGVWVNDGVNWRILGSGIDDVQALLVFNGSLIAAGEINPASGRTHVARWTGAAWVGVGTLVGPNATDSVNALTIFQGEIIAAGEFSSAGGNAVNNIARWNGLTWQTLAGGVPGAVINALEVFDDDAGGPNAAALYVGGMTDAGAPYADKWNGSAWVVVHQPDCVVQDFCVYNNALYCGGRDPNIFIGLVEKLSTTNWLYAHRFTPQGGGIVYSLQVFNGMLVAGGQFSLVQGPSGPVVSAAGVARWNDSVWQPLSTGWSTTKSLGLHQSGLYAAAELDVGRWNGSTWTSLRADGVGNAATMLGSRVIVGGWFSKYPEFGAAPSEIMHNVGGFDGQDWSPLGTGVNGNVVALLGFSNAQADYELVAGGLFTKAGSVSASRIARWIEDGDGQTPGGWSAMGSGFDGTVLTVGRLNGQTIAGGSFFLSGSTPTDHIAKWNESTATWSQMGGGLNQNVRALRVFAQPFPSSNIELVAGGDFTASGATAMNRIARWVESVPPTHGSSWGAMGSGFNGSVMAIERHSGSTYAAGAFTASGVTTLNRLARWNGSAWVAVGTGVGFNNTVRALRSLNGSLYAAGDFTSVDGVAANRMARWNGTVWQAVSPGTTLSINALAAFNNELFAPQQSSGTTARVLVGLPWIIAQPQPQSVACRDTAMIETVIPDGYGSFVDFQWFKNGIALSEGRTPTGSILSGATFSPRLFVQNANDADEGDYSLQIFNSCGSMTTNVVSLDVVDSCAPCVGDVAPLPDGDDMVNVTDLLAVIAAWGATGNNAADTNHDGTVNVTDLLAVIAGWGPCP